ISSHLSKASREQARKQAEENKGEGGFWERVLTSFSKSDSEDEDEDPGLFDVIANSVNIMQDRVTRSRMAGDPPEVTLNPLLPDFAFMDFHRAKEAIDEGHRLVAQHAEVIRGWVGTLD
ncbi:MAG: patatin, partial [Algiphilus sp.]|nr:patatin [Algiphilus sp.]